MTIDMVLFCPMCGVQHIDAPDIDHDPHYEGHMIWDNPPHRSHLCASCGTIWRPADVPTNGVEQITTKGKADNFDERRRRLVSMNMQRPIQPVENGRFVANPLVRHLLDFATPRGCGMNELCFVKCTNADRQQFAQLIGYSIGGYSDLNYVDDAAYDAAIAQAPAPQPVAEVIYGFPGWGFTALQEQHDALVKEHAAQGERLAAAEKAAARLDMLMAWWFGDAPCPDTSMALSSDELFVLCDAALATKDNRP